ncbi:peroxiredoxin [Sporosarcina sp. P33]|uniref:peroxiredoxin family protein n=1 Tax=Sporosarcina sp. P33 TaxID=1930764 RepID=UPI0009BED2F6|nr:redoxin domain-containing protein [Sporosarcina sp. P33]ARD47536.1 thiol-disulfide oxidoreductase [Sporosarcina sp. P33]
MKRAVGILIAILIISGLIVRIVKSDTAINEQNNLVQTGYEESGIESGLEKGNVPPNFELTTLSGDKVKLTDYKGKIVILNFWASWCGPCKVEMPYMQKYYERNKGTANVEIIAVNMTSEERGGSSGIKKFVDEYGLTFPILLDNDGKVMDMYNIITIPNTYIIDKDGLINQKIMGPMNEEMINELVKKLSVK